jgi:branched-chain amino acid transport system ATP-binding protein
MTSLLGLRRRADPALSDDSAPAVAVEGLSKHFEGVTAVEDVSFTLPAGSVSGLIGPNGAGKTTLLNMITGYLSPSTGRVLIRGVSLGGHRPHDVARFGVARTYQNILLLDSETVAANVMIGCHQSLGGRSPIQRLRELGRHPGAARVREMLDVLELGDVADEEVAQLPYGVRRRVEIARALVESPQVLILDEPTAGMTRDESDEIGRLVQRVRENGTTVLLVEHNVRLVRAICDEVLVMQWGRLIARSTAERVWDNETVRAAYLGEADA